MDTNLSIAQEYRVANKGLKLSSIIILIVALIIFVCSGAVNETQLLLIMLLLVLFPFIKTWRSKTFDIFEPINVFVVVFFMANWFMPILRYWDFGTFSNGFAIKMGITNEDFKFGLEVAVIGLIFFYLGYYSKIGKLLTKFLPRLPTKIYKENMKFLICICLVAGGALCLYFFKIGNSSIKYIYANRATIIIPRGMFYHVMVVSLYFASMVLFCYFIKNLKGVFAKKLAYLIPVMTSIPLFMFGGREKVLIFLLVPFIIWHYTIRKLNWKKIAIVSLFVLIFIVLFGYFRAAGNLNFKNIKRLLASEVSAQFSYSETALMVYKYYPKVHGFYYGKLMSQDFLIFMPRLIWQDKPINYGSQLVQLDILPNLADKVTGFGTYEAFSPLGLGYADFGIIGVAFAMFVCGLIWSWIYEFFKRSDTRNPYSVMIFGLMIVMLPKIAGGFMGSILNGIILWIIPLVILLKLCGLKIKMGGADA